LKGYKFESVIGHFSDKNVGYRFVITSAISYAAVNTLINRQIQPWEKSFTPYFLDESYVPWLHPFLSAIPPPPCLYAIAHWPLCWKFETYSFYARKQQLLSARLSHRNSVCLSVTRMIQSKMVQARITKSSPSAARKTLVSGTVKLFHKFEGAKLEGAKW